MTPILLLLFPSTSPVYVHASVDVFTRSRHSSPPTYDLPILLAEYFDLHSSSCDMHGPRKKSKGNCTTSWNNSTIVN
jgi:hypothetical protein